MSSPHNFGIMRPSTSAYQLAADSRRALTYRISCARPAIDKPHKAPSIFAFPARSFLGMTGS